MDLLIKADLDRFLRVYEHSIMYIVLKHIVFYLTSILSKLLVYGCIKTAARTGDNNNLKKIIKL